MHTIIIRKIAHVLYISQNQQQPHTLLLFSSIETHNSQHKVTSLINTSLISKITKTILKNHSTWLIVYKFIHWLRHNFQECNCQEENKSRNTAKLKNSIIISWNLTFVIQKHFQNLNLFSRARLLHSHIK